MTSIRLVSRRHRIAHLAAESDAVREIVAALVVARRNEGRDRSDPPRYELERVRDVVLAVEAAPIAAGPLEPNRDYSLHARLKGQGYRQTVLLWTALSAVVLVLVILTLRLARRESPPSA